MGVVLSNEKLKIVLEKIRINPTDNNSLMEFATILRPVIKLTCDKFPFRFAEDIEQELLMSIIKKAQYIAEKFCSGTIDNPTNYIFRFLYNEGCVAIKKEIKYEAHLVSIEDIKVDKAIMPKSGKKHYIVDRIRSELYEFCELRFTNKKDALQAKRYVDIILEGKRPSLHETKGSRFGASEESKESYSVVLQKVRERAEAYWEELHE